MPRVRLTTVCVSLQAADVCGFASVRRLERNSLSKCNKICIPVLPAVIQVIHFSLNILTISKIGLQIWLLGCCHLVCSGVFLFSFVRSYIDNWVDQRGILRSKINRLARYLKLKVRVSCVTKGALFLPC